jgi:hypothetical protein
LRAGIRLAASTETVGARLEEAGSRGADGRVVRSLGFLIGADTSVASASIRFAAAAEAIRADLEEAGTRSTLSIRERSRSSLSGSLRLVLPGLRLGLGLGGLGLVVGADTSGTGTSVRLAAALEPVGADLEETSSGGALALRKRSRSSLRLPVLFFLFLGLGSNNRLGDKDGIASTLDEISAPLYGTRINGAITAETIVRTSVELANTRTLSLRAGGRSSRDIASNGNKSKDCRMHNGMRLSKN